MQRVRFALAAILVCAGYLVLPCTGPENRILAIPQGRSPNVSVLFSVTEKEGNAVPNLKETDFRILEGGKSRTITSFANASASPLSVVLVVDKSGSTRDNTSEMAKVLDTSMQFFRSALKVGRDKIALIGFDALAAVDQDFTDNFAQLIQAINGTVSQPYGATALHDALSKASTLLAGRQGRRLILLVGDGEDNASRLSLEDAMKAVHKSDVQIVAISTGRRFTSPPNRGTEILERISEETGGRWFAFNDLKQFEKVRRELDAQYTIHYRSTNSKLDGKFRKIRVESVNKAYRIRHRAGYYPVW